MESYILTDNLKIENINMESYNLTDNLKIENIELKKKIKLYEISSKIDYEKIEKLKEEIKTLRQLGQFKIDYGRR